MISRTARLCAVTEVRRDQPIQAVWYIYLRYASCVPCGPASGMVADMVGRKSSLIVNRPRQPRTYSCYTVPSVYRSPTQAPPLLPRARGDPHRTAHDMVMAWSPSVERPRSSVARAYPRPAARPRPCRAAPWAAAGARFTRGARNRLVSVIKEKAKNGVMNNTVMRVNTAVALT